MTDHIDPNQLPDDLVPDPGAAGRAIGTVRGALFPELPAGADRQVAVLGTLVGAVVFSGLLGWGPHGAWLDGLHAPSVRGRPAAAANRHAHRGPSVSAVATPALPIEAAPVQALAVPSTTPPVAASPTTTDDFGDTIVIEPSAASEAASEAVSAPDTVPPDTLATLSIETALPALPQPTTTPTTAAPTTAAPTTATPTTATPTTAAPTTAAPTSGPVVLASTAVEFASGSAQPTAAELRHVEDLASAIRASTGPVVVRIIGTASPEGDPARNLALSRLRALAVERALRTSLGPDAGRVHVATSWSGAESGAGSGALPAARRVTLTASVGNPADVG